MKARFIEPMLLLRTEKLPDSPDLLYEISWTAIARSRSRAQQSPSPLDFSARYPARAKALRSVPAESVIDGEIVAVD